VEKEVLAAGMALLRKPVLPLVGIVQFLYLTGAFATVEEVIDQLPETIETGFAVYEHAAADLSLYIDLLQSLEALKAGQAPREQVIDSEGRPVDAMTATTALVVQRILTRELEQINSLLCGPCNCTLCCIGPEAGMAQAYFEIPLQPDETETFILERIDTAMSRSHRVDDEPSLQVGGDAFYDRPDPMLIHWSHGWSLILPRESRCPNVEDTGNCRIYPLRPQVCRRPQIFPYMVEAVAAPDRAYPLFRLRHTLLAVVDCPYVLQLQEEIAAYAAACELDMIFRRNKE
jgi:Fe-S-cluster containining protein